MACASTSPQQVAEWIDDIAEHARAAEAIAALGSKQAAAAIRDYLQRGPQIIPQPRCFAVAILARWNTAETTLALRQVLHSQLLRDLTPQLAESEYVVKCAAMGVLATRDYPEFADDVAFGIAERLRAAVSEAGRCCFFALAPALAALLDDDVLADASAQALLRLGTPALAALLARIDSWLWQSPYSSRLRLALVRGLPLIAQLKETVVIEDESILMRALCDPHPLVRAAAALALWPCAEREESIDALVRGVLGHDRSIAQACAAALANAGTRLVEPVLCALRRNAEPDIYGEEQSPPELWRRWLTKQALDAAADSNAAREFIEYCPQWVLADAIAHGPPPPISTLHALLQYGAAEVCVAVVSALSRRREQAVVATLTALLDDSDSRVRNSAFGALRMLPDEALASMPRDRLRLRLFRRGLCLRLRLRHQVRKLSRREQQ